MKYVSIFGLIIIAMVGAIVYYMSTPPVETADSTVSRGMPVPETNTFDTAVTDTSSSAVPTSANGAPPGSIHNLPVPEAVAAVRTLAATLAGISENKVIILTAYEKEWSDGCLGIRKVNEGCIQVITPGYEVTVSVNGAEATYHTNKTGTSIRAVR